MKKHYYIQDILDICDNKHVTVNEIFQILQKKYPKVGKSSVYRNVEELTKQEKLSKVSGVGSMVYFEKNKGKHLHLIDQSTGKIHDLAIPKNLIKKIVPDTFEIDGIDIKIFGSFT